jgi:predicted O-methyltransferase YrrM
MSNQLADRFLSRALRSLAFRFRYAATNLERRQHALELKGMGLSNDIPTWTTQAELRALYALAAGVPVGGNIVEIGSYLGASTCYLAAGSAGRKVHIVCVDTWQNETISDAPRDTFAEFSANTKPIASSLTAVRKPSRELTPGDLRLPVHLAFIDADHSYESTKAESEFIAPHIAPDGIIVFHDTATFEGVSRALCELLEQGAFSLAGHVGNLTWVKRAQWTPWPPVQGEQKAVAAAIAE